MMIIRPWNHILALKVACKQPLIGAETLAAKPARFESATTTSHKPFTFSSRFVSQQESCTPGCSCCSVYGSSCKLRSEQFLPVVQTTFIKVLKQHRVLDLVVCHYKMKNCFIWRDYQRPALRRFFFLCKSVIQNTYSNNLFNNLKIQ